MRNVILMVNMTLDGYMAGPRGELDWMVMDPQMNADAWIDLRDRIDTILAGQTTYQGFEDHFHEQAADPRSPAGLVEFANWMLDTPKVVFSRTLSPSGVAKNVRLVEGDIPGEVAALKREPGKDLVLFGGASTVQSFIRSELIDEYWIKLHPVAIGEGLPVFTGLATMASLTLTDSQSYDSGVITLRYRPR